ncbi:cobalt-zinc-cadmium resistance protein CzcD [Vibrio astriarenae]|nr:cobalt-zinc-cadmium resistance protein CzcD [Vibrio sp. C7]
MMKMKKLNAITLATLSSCALFSVAAQANDEFRQHGAHVHGEVEFNVAQDANELLIEIVAPGADVVGFERAPETEAEKQALQQAIATLEQPEQLFSFPANANCALEYKSVSHTLGGDEHDGHDHDEHKHHDHDEHKHHDHDEHKHHDHDEHKHHDHDEHKHHDHDEHKHHDHDEHKHHDHDHDHDHAHDGHGEFTIEYHFECGNIENLTQLETSWMEKFEQTHKISVNILTDRVQGGATLEGSSNRFSL